MLNLAGLFKDYFCLHRKFLLWNLISRNLKLRYRRSFFGLFWTLMIPAGSAGIYFVIFNFVLKVKVAHYLLMILCGLIPWTFFAACITGLEVIAVNHQLLNKIPLPIQSLVEAEVITHYTNLILSIPILLFAFLFSGLGFSWTMIQYPLLFGFLFLNGYSIALIFSLLFVFFRDLKYLSQLLLQFWFYLTPIMYEVKMIPPDFAFLIYLNPVGALFAGVHTAVVDQQWISAVDWTAIIGWSALMTSLSMLLLYRVRQNIVEII